MTTTAVASVAGGVPLPRVRRWLLKILGTLLVLLFASLFVVALWESWWALTEAAVATKIPYPDPWPWMVDGFILAMALMVVHAKQLGLTKWALWGPRLGLVAATCLSTGIQAAWAPAENYAFLLHAWSPLAVLFSFECLIRLLYGTAVPSAAMVRDVGSPDQMAAGVPHAAGSPTNQSGLGHAAASPPATALDEPVSTGKRSLSDRGGVVTPRDQTVTTGRPGSPAQPFTPAQIAILYRQKDNPEGFRAKIAEKGFDPDAAWALAAVRGWGVATSGNGADKLVTAGTAS